MLREEGYEIVLVNSNPATIMTDPEFADRTYVEPLLPEVVAAIIGLEASRRAAADWAAAGAQPRKTSPRRRTLERFRVELIGADYGAISLPRTAMPFAGRWRAEGLRVP